MAVSQQNQPQEPRINGGASGQPPLSSRTTPLTTATVAATATATTTTTLSEELNTASKRQRRPSVRLVEIGDQPAAALTKHWRQQQQQQQQLSSNNNPNSNTNRVSKTRTLTNLGGFDEGDNKEGKSDFESDNLSIGSWKIKGCSSKPNHKRDLKRPRTNWVSKRIHHHLHNNGEEEDDEEEEEDGNGFSRDFEIEGSESPLKGQEQNPVHDLLDDERGLQFRGRARIGGNDDGVDLDVNDDDNGGQNSARRWGGGVGGGEGDGIRAWLDGLGLGRYSPVFEFHEVDEEVLPLLTLEDLKDMGIHAVGSRRKIFCAIQKLNKGFS